MVADQDVLVSKSEDLVSTYFLLTTIVAEYVAASLAVNVVLREHLLDKVLVAAETRHGEVLWDRDVGTAELLLVPDVGVFEVVELDLDLLSDGQLSAIVQDH